ncbi:MAG: class B sortase [Oscillospiraceae bacterium]|nr:class B sortase [Oscillospiraceae bacterium]
MPEFDKRPQRRSGERKVITRKENIFIGILHGLFPWKGDKAGDVIRKIIFLGSLGLMVWAGYQIIDFYVMRDIRIRNEHLGMLTQLEDYGGSEVISIPMSDDRQHNAETKQVNVIGKYYDTFYLDNDDFVGYVEIDPWIQYPVYQYTDNEYYLHHNRNKNTDENGAVFADYEGHFTYAERPHNTILYGHNLITHHMFQPLTYYRPGNHGVDSFEFLKTNPVIKFDTLFEEGKYKIFAVFQSNTRAHQGEVFQYNHVNNIYFENKTAFDNYVADILDRSFYYTNVDIEYGDELLLLVTCDFSMFANGADSSVRLIIAARRVRDDEYFMFSEEEIDAFIDNRGVNEQGQLNRKMFEAYYQYYAPAGWGGRNWDTGYIKDFGQ